MSVETTPPPPGAARAITSAEWDRYSLAMRNLAAVECDPNATPQRRADAALAAHQAWRDFQTAFGASGSVAA